MRRIEAFEIGCHNAHRRESHRQLSQRERLEHAARHIEQLQRLRDIGNRRGLDRFVSDEQRRKLGHLRQRVADGSGIRIGESRGDPGGTQGPGGVRCDSRQGLGKFEGF